MDKLEHSFNEIRGEILNRKMDFNIEFWAESVIFEYSEFH